MLWRPTIGLDEDGAVLAGPAKPWTPACREVCANLWPWCSIWSSSADELTGPLDASSVGVPLWNVECWTASRWTGSLDLVWWSSQETGAPWWLSGHAVELVPEYLPWSASRLSRTCSFTPCCLNSETTGRSSLVNSRGEFASPNGTQVNWYTFLLTLKHRYLRTAWCIGTWR